MEKNEQSQSQHFKDDLLFKLKITTTNTVVIKMYLYPFREEGNINKLYNISDF